MPINFSILILEWGCCGGIRTVWRHIVAIQYMSPHSAFSTLYSDTLLPYSICRLTVRSVHCIATHCCRTVYVASQCVQYTVWRHIVAVQYMSPHSAFSTLYGDTLLPYSICRLTVRSVHCMATHCCRTVYVVSQCVQYTVWRHIVAIQYMSPHSAFSTLYGDTLLPYSICRLTVRSVHCMATHCCHTVYVALQCVQYTVWRHIAAVQYLSPHSAFSTLYGDK